MKKMLLLTMAMVLVGLFLGSVALAQQTTVTDAIGVAPTTALTTGPLAPSGAWILLPIAAFLLGTVVLTYTILRRDR